MEVRTNKLINFVKNNLLIIFSLPVLINTILNLFNQTNNLILSETNFAKLGSFILGTLFFIYLSNFLNNQFLLGESLLDWYCF